MVVDNAVDNVVVVVVDGDGDGDEDDDIHDICC